MTTLIARRALLAAAVAALSTGTQAAEPAFPSGPMRMVVGIAAAWCGASLFQVSVACCAVVFVIELFLVH